MKTSANLPAPLPDQQGDSFGFRPEALFPITHQSGNQKENIL